jgi:hypothetical protein
MRGSAPTFKGAAFEPWVCYIFWSAGQIKRHARELRDISPEMASAVDLMESEALTWHKAASTSVEGSISADLTGLDPKLTHATPAQAASICKRTPSRIRQMLREGSLKGDLVDERWWHIPRSEVERLLKEARLK